MKSFLASLLCAALILTGCQKKAQEFDASNEIAVLSREDGSGTRGAFVELFGVEQKNEQGEKVDRTVISAQITNSTAVMMTSVAGDDYAVGYVSLGSLNDSVKALKINGVAPSAESVKDGSYEVKRPFNIVTKDGLSEIAQDFIDFILSADGQAVVEENGYVAAVTGEPYESKGLTGTVNLQGSSSVAPVMEKLAEAYMSINKDASVKVSTSDSTTGVTSAIEGIADIGMASRDLKDSEKEKGVTGTVIALDGIAVVVNNNNTVDDLTVEQVCGIYTGEVTTWEEVSK